MESNFSYSAAVREDARLRGAFNALAQKTFGLDFSDWYDAGHWSGLYCPHLLLDGDRAVSNVSVNWMQFDLCGEQRRYVQLGTVMTDEAYRGRGLNRQLMERVLADCRGKADGVYLFANDSVLDYYPRFGFAPCKEYEYYLPCPPSGRPRPYRLEPTSPERLCAALEPGAPNPNDGFYMSRNIGLYQFWFAAGLGGCLYYLPEADAYAVVETEGRLLRIQQLFGRQKVDVRRLACSFGPGVEEAVLGYTPACREGLSVREHKEEDTTLFILGGDLRRIERDRLRFPALSHA